MKGMSLMANYKKFKKSLVNLYHGGKTQTSLCKYYSVSFTALSRFTKQTCVRIIKKMK